jgi:hypothetical protein
VLLAQNPATSPDKAVLQACSKKRAPEPIPGYTSQSARGFSDNVERDDVARVHASSSGHQRVGELIGVAVR